MLPPCAAGSLRAVVAAGLAALASGARYVPAAAAAALTGWLVWRLASTEALAVGVVAGAFAFAAALRGRAAPAGPGERRRTAR